ncbi:MAG TPA: glycoside hydrolase family 97 catalytic domain-containing protein [Phycisphaerae bacterium]|nr:glycoside hydrolase family 97 catalytic domain-containing protein [Phycisphaerae bacterium]
MLRPRFFASLLAVALAVGAALADDIASPDKRVVVRVDNDAAGSPRYSVRYDDRVVLAPSPLGLDTADASLSADLRTRRMSAPQPVNDDYRLYHGKRSACRYRANRAVLECGTERGEKLNVIFQVSNDGVAFRYEMPPAGESKHVVVSSEATGFGFPSTTRAWLMPIDDNLSGWGRMNPCYERLYEVDIPATKASPSTEGWAFPALFHVNNIWALISESDVNENYCASRLTTANDEGVLRIAFPDPRENNGKTPVEPDVAPPFRTPWRVIILGDSLKSIVESTLVTDVATPSKIATTDFIRPGTSAWGWLREQNNAMTFDRQRAYIDMAANLGLKHCLIDAEWDERIGYEKMAQLVRHATEKNVGVWLWYNSNGDFNDANQTPRDKMDTPDARRKELARLREMGVTGVKVDFFGGDKQATMRLYMDILKDAADAGILVNFHGATIPRGWERTWPNMMTIEAVRGEENLGWDGSDPAREAEHDCILPFTRNVVGPMDFTPNCLGHHYDPKHLRDRYTTFGFELALTVVYESGVQHLGITPDDATHAPKFAVEFLRSLPATWDETRLIDGFPGRYCVIARRSGDQWFIAGINGQDKPLELDTKLDFIDKPMMGVVIDDNGDRKDLQSRAAGFGGDKRLRLTIPARGGFVWRSKRS